MIDLYTILAATIASPVGSGKRTPIPVAGNVESEVETSVLVLPSERGS